MQSNLLLKSQVYNYSFRGVIRFEGVASPSSKQNRERQIEREKDTDK
jgi:hypothetical protein